MTNKEKLFEIMYEKSFKYQPSAPFTLVSGNISPLYFDCKATMLGPKGLELIASAFRMVLENPNNQILDYNIEGYPKTIQGIGGLTMGADPIIYSVCLSTYLNPLIIRKEAKGHGTKKWIEGNYKEGDKVIVVDDVVTTGSSTIKAIERMREAGLDVVHCIVLVDREELNGKKNIEDLGVKVTSIFKASEFVFRYTQEKI